MFKTALATLAGALTCVGAEPVLAQARADAATSARSPLALPALGETPTAPALPLWELGLGVGVLSLPHYKGSDQRHTWVLPVPHIVYRGERLRVGRGGARAVLLDASRLDVDISLAAGPPTRSRDNEARQGMPDLKPTVEFGPNINWRLRGGRGTLLDQAMSWHLDLRLPWRAAVTFGTDPRYVGWTAAPNLNLDVRTAGGWHLGLLTGPTFNSQRFNAYYYDVDPAYATVTRPSYRGDGGYAGTRALASLSRRVDGHWIGAFVQFDQLHGARFEDSPLMRQKQAWSFGIATSWSLMRSDRIAPDRD